LLKEKRPSSLVDYNLVGSTKNNFFGLIVLAARKMFLG